MLPHHKLSQGEAYLQTKLEPSPAKGGKHPSRVIGRSDLPQASHILSGEAKVRILPFTSIAHVNKLGRNAQLFVDAVKMLGQLTRPSFHTNIILSQVPASAELPN